MVRWNVRYRSTAKDDVEHLRKAGLKERAESIVHCIEENPYYNPPPYEALLGKLKGLYSRRINRHHRIIYKILPATNDVLVYRMYTHYKK